MRRWIVTVGARPEFWLGLLLAWAMLSAARSAGTPWARVALTELLRWGAGISLALALSMGLRRTRTAARALTGSLGAVALAAIWDGLTPGQGVVGPFRDHQLCASCLLILLPFAAAVALTARRPAWRWGAQAIGVAGLICLVLTETRSAWAGLVAAAIVFGILWLHRGGTVLSLRRGRHWVIPALLTLTAMMVFLVIIGPTEFHDPLAHRAGTLRALAQDSSWQGRLAAWRGAGRMIVAQPLMGWGLGRYPGAQWAWTGLGRPLGPLQRPSLSEEAHSLYLQTAAEMGLIGLGLYLASLAMVFRQGLRFLRGVGDSSGRSREPLVMAILALTAGQAVDALASPSWQFAEISLLFWAALGVGMAAMHHADAPEPTAMRLAPAAGRFARFAASGAVALTLLSQFLPLGLLSPVEAYTVTGATYTGATITPANSSASVSGNRQVSFTLKANYTDGTGSHTADVTLDTNSSFSATYDGLHNAFCTFMNGGTGANRNILVLDSRDTGKSLIIRGSFYFNGVGKFATTNLTVTP